MKGQLDSIYYLTIGTLVIIVMFFMTYVWSTLDTNAIATNTIFNPATNPVGVHAQVQSTQAINILDNFSVFLYVIAALAAIVLALFSESNPIFAVLGIIVYPIEILLSYVFHDIFFAFLEGSVVGSAVNQASFPLVITFMQNLPIICAILYLLIIIAEFAK